MLTEKAIRDRFVQCLEEVCIIKSQREVAGKINVADSYLAKIKTHDNPQIPVSLVARFCKAYDYSTAFILLGEGQPTGGKLSEKNKEAIYLQTISDLSKALKSKLLQK